ncbi:MAG: alanine--tRNA ligase, partial [Deltaproteobacteria bacterium]|nr:alanine--tRNA ligase [Deltaproteobacteria bacterium]
FYGEAGGQAGDTGVITGKDLEIKVSNTIKDPTGLVIHKGKIVSGNIKKGETVTLSVDDDKRRSTECSHTATHILHAILRKALGDHVKQAGSLVAPGRLRFDFSHFSMIDTQTLDKIESLVNERIRENIPVGTEEMDAEEAFKTGATALFEEKYGDRVRVVSLADFSKELCGGTHTERTGNIGLFKILGESSVASGVRRIEALTGRAAVEYVQQTSKIVRDTSRLVKEKPEVVPRRIEKILTDQKTLEKEIVKLKAQLAAMSTNDAKEEIKTINGIKVIVKKVAVDSTAALRDLADRFKEKLKSGIVVLGSAAGSKVLLIVIVSKDLANNYHAGNIVKQVAAVVGGGGGGRPDMAQAGGTKPEKLDAALDKAYEVIEKI